MSNTREIIKQKVSIFFKKISWKKILTFLFFVLLSFIFWVMQIYRQPFEATIVIPVKYVNVPDSIIFENDLPLNIDAYIKDDGAALFKYYFTKKKDSLVVDVRKLISSTNEKNFQGHALEQLVREKIFASSQLLNCSPIRTVYSYEVLYQKKLPVIYDGYISLASGYIIDGELSLSSDSVFVYGSRKALDTLNYAHTTSDTIKDVKKSIKETIQMLPIKGIKYTPPTVEITIPVDEFLEREVEIPVVCVNLPKNLTIRFLPSRIKLPFFVGRKRSADITAADFQVTVDYNDIKDLKESSVTITITESPEYVRTQLPVPAEIEFILEQE